ncbi:Spy/CpxP family protein refolding chaperone [Bosea sp. 124]|uniref:Spy/CpxP family protein refolding chaperone n=1 Tax=Bosea sp. 124 TaxID=2135642 RepID=UPI000D3F4987|nr:Spy/CpxP family protein refolding chaperone [Bosea sp. 124]PTM42389.1 LTXXQ motif family protein [Bosea sp. 124]
MKHIALIAASSVAALAATLAIAQPQPLPPAGGDRDSSRHERSESREQRRGEWREQRGQRMQERLNERLAKLRTDMKLKPEQAPLFDTVEALIKKRAEERRAGWSAMREQRETFRHADIMEKLDMMSGRQSARATRSKELADAVRPLWVTLSDEQKTVARRAVREAMAEGRGMMQRMRERMDERRGGHDHDDEDRGQQRRWREDRGDRGDRRG